MLKLPAEPLPGEAAVYTDKSRKAYQAASMKRGAWRTLGFRSIPLMIRAFKAGFRQRKTMGDPWQQGGVLVVDRGGKLLWSFASEAAGHHPPIQAALGALRSA